MSFTLERQLACNYDEALARVPDALKSEGFGVLTEIDVKQTLKNKIGVDLAEDDVAVSVRGLLEDRGERAAGAAPGRPPVEEHDALLLRDGLEVLLGDLDRAHARLQKG